MAEKRRKCWLLAFSPSPAMFSKGLYPRVVKSWDCVVKGFIQPDGGDFGNEAAEKISGTSFFPFYLL